MSPKGSFPFDSGSIGNHSGSISTPEPNEVRFERETCEERGALVPGEMRGSYAPLCFCHPEEGRTKKTPTSPKEKRQDNQKKREIDAMEHLRDVMEDHHPKVERYPSPNGR